MTQDSNNPPLANRDKTVEEQSEQIEALANVLQALIRTLSPAQRTGFISHLKGLTRKGSRVYTEMIGRMR